METRKLYYEDSHLSQFTATVLSCEETEEGFEVILDATAFYPEGGGQAGDTGSLNDVWVKDTQERGGMVVHLCAGPLERGTQVTGEVHYAARFQRMQQHSGEHIVSGLIHRHYGYHNVGFHMGTDIITIDFDGVIPASHLPALELLANQAVWENLPVKCWYPSEEELPNVAYRTKRALPWPVRIVEFPGYDSCACCGTHVQYTGEIGLIKLFSVTGLRGGTRMEMACGSSALELMNTAYEQNKLVSQTFSAKIGETGAAAKAAWQNTLDLKLQIGKLQRRISSFIAEGYAGQGHVVHFEENMDKVAMQKLSEAIARTCGGVAAVFTGSDKTGWDFCMASKTGDLRKFGKEMGKALNGRGGGPATNQYGHVNAGKAEIEAFFAQSREALDQAYALDPMAGRLSHKELRKQADEMMAKLRSDLEKLEKESK